MNASRMTQIPPQSKSKELAETAKLLEQNDKNKPKVERKNEAVVTQVKKDAYVPTPKQEEVTYKKPSSLSLDELRAQADQQVAQFKKLIQSLLAKQGESSNLVLFGEKLNVTPEDSAKAQAAISEGGEYSVDAVATRIVDMAKALSGGDKSKIGVLKDAVLKGFDEARKVWGGEMPQITQDTYDEVMRQFDEWEKGDTVAAE